MPAVPTIVEAAITAITARENGGSSHSALERNLRHGLTDAVDRWLDTAAEISRPDLHVALGRAHARAGRSLEELMGFYRIAAQTMWRRLTELASASGAAPQDIYRLAETGFGCVDELSTQAAEGFADEQSHRSGASHSRRSELVRLLLRDPQPAAETLAAAAAGAGIELTATLAVFAGPAAQYDALSAGVRDPVLLGPREGEFVGALFDPDGPDARRRLARAAQRAGARLALGPPVALSSARESLGQARALLALMDAGLLGEEPLCMAEEHDVALLLSVAPGLAGAIRRRRLAPLERVRGAGTRANLSLTLAAWLRHPGQRKTIAHELGVHPQTVRYRMARLHELFGGALDDPDQRFELELAMRLERYAPAAKAS